MLQYFQYGDTESFMKVCLQIYSNIWLIYYIENTYSYSIHLQGNVYSHFRIELTSSWTQKSLYSTIRICIPVVLSMHTVNQYYIHTYMTSHLRTLNIWTSYSNTCTGRIIDTYSCSCFYMHIRSTIFIYMQVPVWYILYIYVSYYSLWYISKL